MRKKHFLKSVALFLSVILFITSVPEFSFAGSLSETFSEVELNDDVDISDGEAEVVSDVSEAEETAPLKDISLDDSYSVENNDGSFDEAEYGSLAVGDVAGTTSYSIAGGTYGNVTWSIDNHGVLIVDGTGEIPRDKNGYPKWYEYRNIILEAKVKLSGASDLSSFFRNCQNLKKIDVSRMNTSHVKNMGGMFFNCWSLKSIDLSNFDTAEVTNMSCMFSDSGLECLDLSSFNTSAVTSMAEMFSWCVSLKHVNLSSFNTCSVENVAEMFSCCDSLLELDLSIFDLKNTVIGGMGISGCISLICIKTPLNLTEREFLTGYGEWHSLDGALWTELPLNNSASITLQRHPFPVDPVTGYIAKGSYGNVNWSIDKDGLLVVEGTGDYKKTYNNTFGPGASSPWDRYASQIKRARIKLTRTTDIDYMFAGCTSLTDLDISEFDTSYVKSMWGAFCNCSSLKHIDTSKMNTSRVETMDDAFAGCSALTDLDVSKFDMSSVSTIAGMFSGCSSLKSVDISSWDLSSAVNMGCLFWGCSSLENVDFSNKNLSKVLHVNGLFYGCSSLKNVIFSNLKTTSLQSMDSMFSGCDSLENVYIYNIDTSSVRYLENMFYGCKSLHYLDMSHFSLPSAESVDYIFEGCDALQQIKTPIKLSKTIDLPENGIWYDVGGNKWEGLPKNNSNSITLQRKSSVKNGKFYFPDVQNEERRDCSHNGDFEVDLDDFFSSSYFYKHGLMRASICLAMAAMDYKYNKAKDNISERIDLPIKKYEFYRTKIDGSAGENIELMLKSMDFKDIIINYPEPNGKDSIGYAIGNQVIDETNGQKTVLLAVGIRGAGYGSEWEGNAYLGAYGDHAGFKLAAGMVIEGIKEYINYLKRECKLSEQDRIKIWMAGYSRAAATANLAAALLDDGCISFISPEDVFAFCYECPKGAVSDEKNAARYSNIRNIINPDDLVPNVAMEFGHWNFGRYGVDYCLPSWVNTNSVEYILLREKMFNEYLKTNPNPVEVNNYIKHEPAQSLFFDNLIANLCILIPTRGDYLSSSLEEYLMKYLKDEKISDIVSFGLAFIEFEKSRLSFSLQGVINYLKMKAAVRSIEADLLTSAWFIIRTHYPELCLAWVNSLPEEELTKKRPYIKYLWNCPVDVEVYDENGVLVGAIYNDTVQEIENGIASYVDSNGQKIFAYPQDAGYTVRIIGTDAGEMTCTVEKYGNDTSKPDEIVSYIDIPVEKGTEYTGTIEDESFVITDESNEELVPDVAVSGDEIKYLSVEINSVGEGDAYGTSFARPGEVAALTALPNDEHMFIAWLDKDGNCLSTDESYKICVVEDTTVTALFTDDDSDDRYVVFKPENGSGGNYYKAGLNSSVVIPSENPTKADYNFLGWYTEKNGKGTKVTDKMKVRENLVLYAYWVKENCTVTFATDKFEYYNDVSGNVAGMDSVTVQGGATCHLENPQPIEGYSFGGWFTGENGSGEQYTDSTMIIDDVTLYPFWKHTGFSVGAIEDYVYTGTPITPVVKVYDGTRLLEINKDYTLEYSNNVNAAGKSDEKAPTIIVNGIGNYAGSAELTFNILPKDLGDGDVTAKDIILNYTGAWLFAVPAILHNGKALASGENKDYTFEVYAAGEETPVERLADIGNYKIVATGHGNYTGTKEINLEVAKLTPISKVSVAKIYDVEYTGDAIEPKVTLTYGGRVLKAYSDDETSYDYTVSYSNNVDAGIATITITGNRAAGFSGTRTVKFEIKGTPINKVNVANTDGTNFTTSYPYTGSYIRPKLRLTVKKGDTVTTLESGTDYSLTYLDNKEVGTATIRIIGKGRYTGTKEITFAITPYSLKADTEGIVEVNGIPVTDGKIVFPEGEEIKVPYTKGSVKVSDLTVTFNGKKLTLGTDYSVSYTNSKKAADCTDAKAPTLTIKGKGSFADSLSLKFTITKQSIASESISMTLTEPEYTNQTGIWKVKPALKESNGQTLKEGTDYDNITYSYLNDTEIKVAGETVNRAAGDLVTDKDIIPIGTVIRITVTGKGNYGATDEHGAPYTRSADYIVRSETISAAVVGIAVQDYVGSEIIPGAADVTVTVAGRSTPLTYGVDYTIEAGSDNVNAGDEATVVIRGIGDYSGVITRVFTIRAKEISWWWTID